MPLDGGGLRPHGAIFQFVGEFDDVAEALGGIDRERLADHRIEPRRQVGTIARQRNRLAEARPRKWFDLAIGIGGGEGAVDRHAQRIEIGKFVAGAPAEKFGRHVTRGARNVLRRKILEQRHPGDAEIDQPQSAARQQDDVIRLDVAMNDAGAMQGRHRAGQLGRDPDALTE